MIGFWHFMLRVNLRRIFGFIATADNFGMLLYTVETSSKVIVELQFSLFS